MKNLVSLARVYTQGIRIVKQFGTLTNSVLVFHTYIIGKVMYS